MANANDITVMIEVKTSDLAYACIKGLVEGGTLVEVVRCKDCEFYYEDEKWCRRLGSCGAFNQDDFCSHGERREDGNETD